MVLADDFSNSAEPIRPVRPSNGFRPTWPGTSRRESAMRNLFARAAALTILTTIMLTAAAGSALACGGLVTPNGTVSLLKTTTLAAYHEGIEHYITSFEFAGEGQEVGSIIPLPGVPTDVIKGGDWTLQRLILETQPQFPAADGALLRHRGSGTRRGHHDQEDRRARHHRAEGRRGGGRELGTRARLLPPARRSRGAGLLRGAEPDLPRRPLQRRARGQPRRARPARALRCIS